MIINTVIEYEDKFLVNDSIGVMKNSGSSTLQLINEWIANGNTPEQYRDPEPTYTELRQAEYPSITEQFDMQYWDSVNNTNKWAETIAEIKDKYPKP